MFNINFSLADYKEGLTKNLYTPPNTLCPYYDVDPALFKKIGNTDQRRNDLRRSLNELRMRTGEIYFGKTYPLQARTLDYSARSFPAYRFILPEVISEDWLAIVDWGKFQRDHVLHQPLCGYVLLKLLGGNENGSVLTLNNGKTILDTCVDSLLQWEKTAYIREFLIKFGMKENDPILQADSPIAHGVWRAFFREAAYVAAVFHDLGYPWQYAERLHCNLDGINTPTLSQNRSAAQIVKLFSNRMLFHALQGYITPDSACPSTWQDRIEKLTDQSLTKTHGLPGALGFLHLNDCVRRYPSPNESPLHLLCVEWVATAIMMHDMNGIYWGNKSSGSKIPDNPFLRLSFDRDPLSAIVTLTDVIQDFERPTASFDKSTNQQVSLQYGSACSSTELDIDSNGVMTLKYKMVSDDTRAIKRNILPKENYEYFDTQYGYLDMSSLGIKRVIMTAC